MKHQSDRARVAWSLLAAAIALALAVGFAIACLGDLAVGAIKRVLLTVKKSLLLFDFDESD